MKALIFASLLAVTGVQAGEFVSPAVPYGSVVAIVGPSPTLCFRGGWNLPNDYSTWRCRQTRAYSADEPGFWQLPTITLPGNTNVLTTPVVVVGADHAWIQDDAGVYVPMSRKD